MYEEDIYEVDECECDTYDVEFNENKDERKQRRDYYHAWFRYLDSFENEE